MDAVKKAKSVPLALPHRSPPRDYIPKSKSKQSEVTRQNTPPIKIQVIRAPEK